MSALGHLLVLVQRMPSNRVVSHFRSPVLFYVAALLASAFLMPHVSRLVLFGSRTALLSAIL